MSIKRINLIIVAILVTFTLFSLIGSLALVDRDNRASTERFLDESARIASSVLAAQIGIYERLLGRLSREPGVQDLFLLADPGEAFSWAVEQREHLPDGIGLALVGVDGRIYGNPPQLRVGPRCEANLRALVEGGEGVRSPVHKETPSLAHFDLIRPVASNEGEQLGLIFGSFSLDVLKASVERLTQQGERLTLIDQDGDTIAEADKAGDAASLVVREIGVPGTQWSLRVQRIPVGVSPPVGWTLAAYFLLVLLLSGVLLVMSRRIVAKLGREFDNIKVTLECVAEGRNVNCLSEPQFKETRHIVPQINQIAALLKRQRDDLVDLSLTDDLCRLPNRRRFDEEIRLAWCRAERGNPSSLVLLDIDRFKRLNDTLGHGAGDGVLQVLAECLREHTRGSDVAARLGGDEFAVIFHSMKLESLGAWFERLLDAFMASQAGDDVASATLRCTLSAGAVAIDSEVYGTANQVVKAADAALYRAKSEGRNRIHVVAVDRQELSAKAGGKGQ